MENKLKISVALTGATGMIYGIRLLEALKTAGTVETHLVMSAWAEKNIEMETAYKVRDIEKLANFVYDNDNLNAPIASGSFLTYGMVVVPCSMKTLSAVACGYADDLISRAADVMLKERRALLLAVRETPLSLIHLNNMSAVAQAGGIIIPPIPSFYNWPETIDDLVDNFAGRIMDILHIPNQYARRWGDLNGPCL